MNKHAIWHICDYPWAAASDTTTMCIRLRTAKNDMTACRLFYKCRYDWLSKYQTTAMIKVASDELFDYWQAECSVDRQRYRYYFELCALSGEQGYFGERGFSLEPIDNKYCFQFPYNAQADIYEEVDWLQRGVVYQIFPDRFHNSGVPKTGVTGDWGSAVNRHSKMGGDLRGIVEKLPYIKKLGANIVYLTPVFLSNTNHKYNTADYYAIDPDFGSVADVRELAERTHALGMRLVLDAVFNHCGDDFFAFEDCKKNGRKSRYWNWFFINGAIVDMKKSNYEMFADSANMPKLNTANPEVREYLLDVVCHWQRELNLDGWRLDVCDEVDHEFWRAFRKRVKAINPQAAIVGEIMHHSQPWLRGEQFDGIMNYTFREAAIDYFGQRSINGGEFVNALNSARMLYSEPINRQLWNLLGSHDRPRLLDECRFKKKRAIMAIIFQYCYLGVPYIYYGDEIGMTGAHDPHCRKCMSWDERSHDKKIFGLFELLNRLRAEQGDLLVDGTVEMKLTANGLLLLKREHDGQELLVVFNNNDGLLGLELISGKYYDVLKQKQRRIGANLTIAANSAVVLMRQVVL